MKKILWIDDEEELIDRSMPFFSDNGIQLLKAANTSRALKILREENVDGVLLDVHLQGGESGLELLEELRHQYPDIKIVIFTGYPEYDDHVKSIMLGASIYLEKIEKCIPIEADKQRNFFDALHKIFSKEFKTNVAHHGTIHSSMPSMTTKEGSLQDEIQHVQRLLRINTRRLRELEARAALYGSNTPPEVMIEIEDLMIEIERLKTQLGF